MITELAPGRLYRLGIEVEIDDRISWVPEGTGGYEPLSAYLILDGAEALLIDTGPAVMVHALVDQVRELLQGRELSVYVSRNEPDVLGGLGAVIEEFKPRCVYYCGGGGLLDWIGDARMEPSVVLAFRDSVPVAFTAPGDRIQVGSGPAVELLPTHLIMLGSAWAYDPSSRALFTSDSFCHLHMDRTTDSVVSDEMDQRSGMAESVAAHLYRRFDWASGLADRFYAEEIERRFEATPIDIVAPARGRVLLSAPAITRHANWMAQALFHRSPAGDNAEIEAGRT